MSKSNTFENDFLKLIYNATPIANLADNAASSPLTNLYLTLHTADPGEAGNQSTNEVSYTGFARIAVGRNNTDLVVTNNQVVPANDVEFAEAGVGVNTSATFWSIGTSLSGTGKILHSGAISPTINITQGVVPRLGSFNISED
jgi:hypothetical protein